MNAHPPALSPAPPAPQKGWPLLAIVTSVVIILVVASTAAIAVSAYLTGQDSVETLWRQLADNIAHRSAGEVLRYLDGARPFVRGSDALVDVGAIDASDPQAMLAYLETELDANPRMSWASWGDEQGTFVSVYRWTVDEGEWPLRRTIRTQIDGAPLADDGHPKASFKDDERIDGIWRPLEEGVLRPYDPRTRPWYTAVAKNPRGVGHWVEPYIYTSRLQPGVAFAYPSHRRDGTLRGVWAAEYEAKPLSDFMARIAVGDHGRVYVIASDGAVIAHPKGEVIDSSGATPKFHHADRHPDPMLASAWRAFKGRGAQSQESFEVGDYLAMARSLPKAAGIPWVVMTVVPREDFLGGVDQQATTALWIAIAVVLLLTGGGLLVSRSLTRSLRRVHGEMNRIARFQLEALPASAGGATGKQPSIIREINEMTAATETMRSGLTSFARYVPHQLVAKLLAADGHAELGGELREMTVVFSDIVGFTTLVESQAPGVVVEALGEYLGAMNAAIGQTDGTVCQYLGDAIMAFWGAPGRQEDHALRACRGLLAMRQVSRELVAEAQAHGRPIMRTRFGANSGQVMVGNIGAPDRFNYGILGDPVNSAARMESLNKVYGTEILVGEATAMAVNESLLIRPIDQVRMKGKTKPTRVYSLMGERATASSEMSALASGYGDALNLYRDGRFAEAAEAFRLLSQTHPDDAPSQLMLARCEAFSAAPPAQWEGVFVMQSK